MFGCTSEEEEGSFLHWVEKAFLPSPSNDPDAIPYPQVQESQVSVYYKEECDDDHTHLAIGHNSFPGGKCPIAGGIQDQYVKC